LLVLDEPTSAMDAPSEARFFSKLKQQLGHRSVLLISHRLSSLRWADYIYVLGGGRVLEQGRCEPLLRLRGEFARLYDGQEKDGLAEGRLAP